MHNAHCYCEAFSLTAGMSAGIRDFRVFVLRRAGREMRATGRLQTLPGGARSSLGARVDALLADCGQDTPPHVVGALPFSADEPEVLYQPAHVAHGRFEPGTTGTLTPPSIAQERPSASAYADMVRAALASIATPGTGGLHKVVLARQIVLQLAHGFDPLALLDALSTDPQIAAYCLELDADPAGQQHLFMGATPELLVSRKGDAVFSEPLAGSIPRGRDPQQDEERAATLLASEKDRREHRITVEYILDLLAPHCAQLDTPGGMGLRSTASMWHLGTKIEGRLKSADGPSALELAALLHPTPAVGGYPLDKALATIQRLEPHSRGLYAGTIGHVDRNGDGEWYVAIRCAQIEGDRMTLHAGAGIVEGSIPEEEVRETAAKFRAMLRAVGIADTPFHRASVHA